MDALNLDRVRLMAHDWGGWSGFHIRCRNVDQLRMVNALCRLVEVATEQVNRSRPRVA